MTANLNFNIIPELCDTNNTSSPQREKAYTLLSIDEPLSIVYIANVKALTMQKIGECIYYRVFSAMKISFMQNKGGLGEG